MELKLLELKNKGTKAKNTWIDDAGYLYSLSYDDINDKRTKQHSRFAKYNPYTIENIKHYLETNNITTQLLSIKYVDNNNNHCLLFQCGMCGKKFQRDWHHFYSGRYKYCQDCITQIQSTQKYFSIDDIKAKCLVYGYKVLQDNYYGNRESLDVEDADGYRGRTTWNDIHSGKHFIKFRLENPYFYYNVRNYFRVNNYDCDIIENSGNRRKGKFSFICECGKKYEATLDQVLNNNMPRIRCQACTNSISNGEKAIMTWLKKQDIQYKYQYKFNDCRNIKPLPFDFYLPDYNICIEFDGAYHYRQQPHVTEQQFNAQQFRDNIKDNYCNQNNIKLIRIPYWTLYNKKYKNILKQNILM